MLIPVPKTLFGLVECQNGEWILIKEATQEQKKAFDKFVQDTKAETIIFE